MQKTQAERNTMKLNRNSSSTVVVKSGCTRDGLTGDGFHTWMIEATTNANGGEEVSMFIQCRYQAFAASEYGSSFLIFILQ